MAEEEQVLAAAFPAPPPFFKYFTEEKLAQLEEIKASSAAAAPSAGDANGSDNLENLPDFPPELRYLIPPSAPADGKYRLFGDQWDINETLPTLAAAGVPQLYPSPPLANGEPAQSSSNPAVHLKALLRSTLLSFLELVDILAVNPAEAFAKIEHFRVLFLNMHHLINEYRSHQARETLILMMEEQIEKRRAEIEGVGRMRERVEEVLRSVGGIDEDAEDGVDRAEGEGGTVLDREVEKREELQLRVWDALDEIEL